MNAILQPRLREPGLRRLDPGVERYRVRGGGAILVKLDQGDRLQIVDLEGRQPCELVVLGRDGRSDAAALGLTAGRVPEGLPRVIDQAGPFGDTLAAALRQRGIDYNPETPAVYLFEGDSSAGEQVSYTAQREVACLLGAPGGPMPADRQNPPTDLLVFIHRARPDGEQAPLLPTPLADPRDEFQIDRRTARAYQIKAGEFIQVIDIFGRQCSDFQAFPLRALDKGLERCLDATTTRSLLGVAYPEPGLYSKFFNVDMEPLVEVVQDTCGRHDTFGLACNARYYEDQGYLGHDNCTDNFNRELAPYGIAPRRGWEAINFFFNTAFDDLYQFYFDEPWSRPGDYVLLKALTDMICVSSACPCDIDPANAWNPTDIHVRVYPAQNTFKKAVAYRMTTDADPVLTRETGFHPRTSQLTRNFTEYRGFWLPTRYNNHGAIDEYWACRQGAAIMDLSPLRKFEVLGPDAEALLQLALTRNVRKLAPGQVVYTAMCYDTGGMLDDGTVFRLGQDNFRWIGGDDYGGVWLRQLAEERNLRVWVKSATEQLHNVAVQGPNSRDILKQVIWTKPDQPTVEELGWFRFTIGRIGDFHGIPVVVSRTGYSGELGYEVFCHPNDAPAVWDAIREAGKPYDLTPLGLEALDMLRIEAGLIFANSEFDDQVDPFEAGIGFTVPLKTKEDDFIGKAALLKRKANPQRTLVGLELAGDEPAAPGDCVHVGRLQVGTVTSATRSPILRKNIALCRMAVEYAGEGTEVEVGKLDGHQKRIPAQVVPFPFYDPKKERVRG